MIGAIAGDIAGSIYEAHNIKTKEFPLFSPASRFTDDTVLTVALADALLAGTPYDANLRAYYARYPHAGYGGGFRQWARTPGTGPYQSWGNGAAMRVSPVGFAFDDLDTVLARARDVTAVTHDHPEGIRGAQATAAAVYLARAGAPKAEIRRYVEEAFGYPLDTPVDVIRPGYTFDVSCQGTVPVAIRVFLESTDFEDALRTAISMGGDSDTLACITGGIAQAYYGGVPAAIVAEVYARLDAHLAAVTRRFTDRFLSRT